MDDSPGDDVTDPPHLPIDPDLTPSAGAEAGVAAGRRWDIALVVAAGGAVGGAARWALSEAVQLEPGRFPWATFTENVLGCLLLGAALVLIVDVWKPHRYARPFIGVGVLGGFTTFSAYTSETTALLIDGEGGLAMAYLFGTLVVGLAATWLGLVLVRTAVGITPRGTARRSA